VFKKKSPEQQIIVEAEKVASTKESLDALSWNRVAEIAKDLQENISDDEREEYGRELLAISQANTSLIGKLGISNNSFSGQVMPSGIEVLRDSSSPTESFDPEEPQVFGEVSKSELDEISPGDAKLAALSFLYEEAGQAVTQSAEQSVDSAIEENQEASLTKQIEEQEITEECVALEVAAEETQVINLPENNPLDETQVMNALAGESVEDELLDEAKKKDRKKKKKKKSRELEGYILINQIEKGR
jgi:hypothetical protein